MSKKTHISEDIEPLKLRSSPSQLAWRKFRRNIPAMLGMGYVAMCVLGAIFAYLLAPDHTRHANFQMLELAKQAPGSSAYVLLVPKPDPPQNSPGAWLTGYQQQALPIPLQADGHLKIEDEQVFFTKKSGEESSLSLGAFQEKSLSAESFRTKYIQKKRFMLGTDAYGRDLLSRILLGARVSLGVGTLAVLICLLIGVSLGVTAGYFGGWVDRFIMWLISVFWSIPTLLMALAISFVLGKGFWQLFVAIGLSMWVEVARMVRGQVMSARELAYAEAGVALGFRSTRIMFRHILPNIISPIIVIAVANFGAAVLIESGLSFLGIGVEVPIPSWGRMIYEGYTFIMFENGQWLAIFPGLALILLVVSVNLIGIGLRDAWDVKL